MSIDELPDNHKEEALRMRERVMLYVQRKILQQCVYLQNEPVEEGSEGIESKN